MKLTELQMEKLENAIQEYLKILSSSSLDLDTIQNASLEIDYLTPDTLFTDSRLAKKLVKMGLAKKVVDEFGDITDITDGGERYCYAFTDKIVDFAEANGLRTMREARGRRTCGRCAGKGYIREFGHIEGGRCFECNK